MDRLIEQAALLALLRGRKAGWSLVADEVEECGSALEVLRRGGPQSPAQGELFAPGMSVDAEQLLDKARAQLQAWIAAGLRLVTLLDADYPAHLLTIQPTSQANSSRPR